jgi:SNF2 family DNA or RNA helicase
VNLPGNGIIEPRIGDRFLLPVTPEVCQTGRIPLPQWLRPLLGSAEAPILVTVTAAGRRAASGTWDAQHGLLHVPGLCELIGVPAGGGRLALEVEGTFPPTFKLDFPGAAGQGLPGDFPPAEVGNVPVRLQASAAEVLAQLARGEHVSLEAYRLHRWAHTIALSPGFDELVSLPFLQGVIPYEHQLAAVRTVLNQMRGRAILADEVGLGKTIEAGIILAELHRRKLVRRVLVLVPPGLVAQWVEELRRKFCLDFVSHDGEAFRGAGPGAWRRWERVVASFHTAKRPEHARVIQDIAYDLVIVDEAHHLRSARTMLWQFINGLRRTYLLLLTATPVQNDLEELFNLVTLLEPGQLKTLKAFRRDHVARGDRRQPKDAEGLRRLLAGVMVRNRRATTAVGLTRRVARTILVDPDPPEQALYADLSNVLLQQYRRGAGITRMIVQTLQMELGSSLRAAVPTLERLLAREGLGRDASEALQGHLALARELPGEAKNRALLELLAAWGDKLLIFTRYRATQDHLARLLGEAGEACAVYHGGLSRQAKEEAVRAFGGPCRILVSTEAGGEGRNLQFAHGLVNYDLPWNPMRIEQRIGRLSRVGQTRDVHVFNLVARGTIEDTLLAVLDTKINMFELVIGEIDMILGELETDQDFEDVVMDLWLAAEGREDFRRKMEALGDRLLQAKLAYLEARALDDRLFGDALAPRGTT